ncbi:glycosyltransferase [Spirosoma sp. HMF3257]|uniref:Glycosyltransferase family 2 protein n=1 Tax=Spirosoma telluris TaxID=2183553 RepID=A0A327NIS3_9BACT|nr:glycosyltransferase [Spirosoma telluris]RAI74745.1 glycosyltransferase family 2 protein [Spirosoma telluris]
MPARNEADYLEYALDALRTQRQSNGRPMPMWEYEVLVLLNNCTDQSVTIAQRYQQRYPAFSLRIASIQLPPEKANVGNARRLLMDEAYKRLMSVGNPTGIIASTDSDTQVDTYWIAQIRAEMDKGCEAVGGRILTHPNNNPVRLNHLRDVTYRMLIAQLEAYLDPSPSDPWPRHFQHFGASIALTCAAYQRVGGLPNVPYLEDEALYKALVRMDTRIRKSPQVRVMTSSRMQGRVEVGFSEQLRYWETMNQARKCQVVEAAGAIVQRIQNRQRLREIWQNRATQVQIPELDEIAANLLIDSDWLCCQVVKSCYFGQLWERVEEQLATGKWASVWPLVPITTAIDELRLFLRTNSQL